MRDEPVKRYLMIASVASLSACAVQPDFGRQTLFYRLHGNQVVLSAARAASVEECFGAITTPAIHKQLEARGREGSAIFRLKRIETPHFPPVPEMEEGAIVLYERKAVVRGQAIYFECVNSSFYWIDAVR